MVWQLDSKLPSIRKLQASSPNLGVGIYSMAESPAYQVEPRAGHDHLVLLGYACLDTEKIAIGLERPWKRMVDYDPVKRYRPASSSTPRSHLPVSFLSCISL